jgi:alpha-tubulin suppressor-like RCC1 family protein
MAKGDAQKLHNARQMLAWGGNTCGQLGVGNDVDQPYPLSIPSFRQSSKWHGRIVDAWVGAWHSFVHLSEPNELVAFGYNRCASLPTARLEI